MQGYKEVLNVSVHKANAQHIYAYALLYLYSSE